MKPVYPQSDYAPIKNFDAYSIMLSNNGNINTDFVKPWAEKWVVLQPEDLLLKLAERIPMIPKIYDLSIPKDHPTRFIKFRTMMVILNEVATSRDTSISKTEFMEIVFDSLPDIPGGASPWCTFEFLSI